MYALQDEQAAIAFTTPHTNILAQFLKSPINQSSASTPLERGGLEANICKVVGEIENGLRREVHRTLLDVHGDEH